MAKPKPNEEPKRGKDEQAVKKDDLPRMPRFNPEAPATAEFPPGRGPYKPT